MARAVYVTCYYKLASSEASRSDCSQGVRPKQFALGEANMTELPPQLRQVRDFFFKQALALSPERTYLHQPELIKNQTIFRLEDLRKHLNNPFLDLDFVQIIDRGQLIDLRAARCFKIVQRRQIKFVNRLLLQQHLENGAACLLEGVDILEPQVNLLATALDRAHSCTFSNAVVFFPSTAAKHTGVISIRMTCSRSILRVRKNGACTDANRLDGPTWSSWGNRKWGRSMPSWSCTPGTYCSCAAARRTRSRRSATIPCTFPLTSATVPRASKPCSTCCSSVTTAIPCGLTVP